MQDTSLAAYDAIRSTLTHREQSVWDALRRCTAAPTAYELFCKMQQAGTAKDLNDVRPRLSDMAERGCVETVGKRPCAVTGKLAMTWRVKLAHPPQPATVTGHDTNKPIDGRLI